MKNFPELIHELGELMGVSLEIDAKEACTLEVNQKFNVQIELDPSRERVLLVAMVSELPPGKFRENILRDGLKANYLAEEKQGVLSYIDRQNSLVLFEYLQVEGLNTEILFQRLQKFIDRALQWHTSIENGHSSPDIGEIPQAPNKQGPMFGLK
jgi:hypothetical protein